MLKTKVALDKELQQERNSTLADQRDAIKEVKLLMHGDAIEDNRIISKVGQNSSIIRAMGEAGKVIEMENLEA